jgi:starch phosphorylase
MRETIFSDFARVLPDRFTNQTNGITPRRWLAQANPALATVIDGRIGRDWRGDLDRLSSLRSAADEPDVQEAFAAAKAANKRRLADHIHRELGLSLDPEALFDVQVKRIHEYKRQLLNVLGVIARYNAIVAAPRKDWVPRNVIIAGKAAPGYRMAKLIIKLIHDVAKRINGDPQARGLLTLVFVPNYNVSSAEVIIPGADLSQQISTAGTEASGTGNMKLALNGALTLGTEDGANIEIRDAVGAENVFIFGHDAAEARELRHGYDPWRFYCGDAALRQALDQIAAGMFSPDDPGRFRPLVENLLWHGDEYLLCADFRSYLDAQAHVDATWRNRRAWNRMAIVNVAGMGAFSSDRTIRGYAESIWRLKPTA